MRNAFFALLVFVVPAVASAAGARVDSQVSRLRAERTTVPESVRRTSAQEQLRNELRAPTRADIRDTKGAKGQVERALCSYRGICG